MGFVLKQKICFNKKGVPQVCKTYFSFSLFLFQKAVSTVVNKNDVLQTEFTKRKTHVIMYSVLLCTPIHISSDELIGSRTVGPTTQPAEREKKSTNGIYFYFRSRTLFYITLHGVYSMNIVQFGYF